MLKTCDVCERELSGHRYAILGYTVAADTDRLKQFVGHFNGREWNVLIHFGDFDPLKNIATIYVITGPHDDGSAILVRNPFELYDHPEICGFKLLGPQEVASITELLNSNSWHNF